MLNRFGEPLEIVVGKGNPFLLVEPRIGEALEPYLQGRGYEVNLDRSSPGVVNSVDPNDPGEFWLNIAPETDLNRLQDEIDSIEFDFRGRIVEAE